MAAKASWHIWNETTSLSPYVYDLQYVLVQFGLSYGQSLKNVPEGTDVLRK